MLTKQHMKTITAAKVCCSLLARQPKRKSSPNACMRRFSQVNFPTLLLNPVVSNPIFVAACTKTFFIAQQDSDASNHYVAL